MSLSSKAMAIVNKIGAPGSMAVNSYYDRKVKNKNAEVDKDVASIKDYRAMRGSGSSVTSTPAFQKSQAVYEAIKGKYNK